MNDDDDVVDGEDDAEEEEDDNADVVRVRTLSTARESACRPRRAAALKASRCNGDRKKIPGRSTFHFVDSAYLKLGFSSLLFLSQPSLYLQFLCTSVFAFELGLLLSPVEFLPFWCRSVLQPACY